MLNRRSLITLAGTAALAACQSGAGTITIGIPDSWKTAVADLTNIVAKLDGLRALMPASWQAMLDKTKALLAQIVAATSTTSLAGLFGAVLPLVSGIVGALPLTGSAGTIVSAIETVLPSIAELAGLVGLLGRRRATGMSIQQARAVLAG